ncbi:hypothetical protein OG946_31790 [Streptomyces sp. NBC_01808]|uniref:hypothetical protein n=1 Tax=Streptomyces sp. NBC_01808 TaxID=2975947 RepID=UPI002DDABEA6|nr:hypothetical protein [Streptomyces sp. NBC_01808]WSA41558.1 hypothetical protein OG946_31790 [Streptomyces sp. NBC_01808]
MAISLSVVLMMGIILIVLIRSGSVKAGPAITAVLSGFLPASTGSGPELQDFLDEMAESISAPGT